MSENKQLTVVEQPTSEAVALTVVQRAAVALKADDLETKLRALVKSTADITEVNSAAGRDQVHTAAMVLLKQRTGLGTIADAAVEDAKGFVKAVNEQRKALIAISTPEEERLFALRDGWDEKVKAEKQVKLAAEKARVDGIRAKIDEIRNLPASMVGKSSNEIGVAADHLSEYVIGLDEWQEFAGEAACERDAAVTRLRDMQEAQRTHEAEQARLAAEREALELQRAALAEQERLAAVERAQREAMDRAERERIAAEQQAAQEKAAAELRAQQEAHAKLVCEQQAELASQQAAIDAQRAEAERVERERVAAIEAEARAKRDAEEAEAARIAQAEADRIFAEHEVQRVAAEAVEAERQRRERVDFEKNGPGDAEIVKTLAEHYDICIGDVMGWMKKFDYVAADEYFAAANVAAN